MWLCRWLPSAPPGFARCARCMPVAQHCSQRVGHYRVFDPLGQSLPAREGRASSAPARRSAWRSSLLSGRPAGRLLPLARGAVWPHPLPAPGCRRSATRHDAPRALGRDPPVGVLGRHEPSHPLAATLRAYLSVCLMACRRVFTCRRARREMRQTVRRSHMVIVLHASPVMANRLRPPAEPPR